MLAFARPKGKPVASLARFFLPLLFTVAVWPEQLVSDMPEQVLRSHHINLTKQGVIAALGSDNAEVRKYASRVLSSHWPKNAASPIEVAMLRENVEFNRVSMAFDLTKLGDNAGREMLVSECHNTSEWRSTRMLAARYMSELREDSCVDSVLDVLQSDSDPQDTISKTEALELVPSFIGHPTVQDSRRVLELVAGALDDPDLGVRLTASNMLVHLGDVSAIPRLQAALEREQDETVHGAMLGDLKRLEELRAADPKSQNH